MKISSNSLGLQHTCPIGSAMTGVLPAADPVFDPSRAVYVAATSAGAGNGLFNPTPYANYVNPFCTTAFISVGSSVTWTVYMTSGLADGDAATTVDNPNRDVPIVNGTGPALALINRELLRSQRIRIVTSAAAVVDTFVILNFAATASSGGRLVA